MRGMEDFEGRPPVTNLRALLVLPDPVYFYFLVRPEIPLANLVDIKNKTMKPCAGMIPRGSISEWGWLETPN